MSAFLCLQQDCYVFFIKIKNYYHFLGIPYASPPTGKLRLFPPVTAAHWSGTLNADRPAPMCPQPDSRSSSAPSNSSKNSNSSPANDWILKNVTQQEDCLYLNIFTPISGKLLFCFC